MRKQLFFLDDVATVTWDLSQSSTSSESVQIICTLPRVQVPFSVFLSFCFADHLNLSGEAFDLLLAGLGVISASGNG